MGRKDLISTYLFYLRVERGLAESSCVTYGTQLKKLKLWTRKARTSFRALTEKDIRQWMMQMTKAGLRTQTIAIALVAAKGFFTYLVREGYVKRNPLQKIKIPEGEKKLPRYLSEEEMDLLLAQPDVNTYKGLLDRAILELLYASGLRVSEVINLQIKDINLTRRLVTCNGKGSKQRCIPIGKSAQA